MMKISSKHQDGRYLIKQARKAGLEVQRGKGDHVKIRGLAGRGFMICPDRKMGKGLAATVVKWLLRAGVPIAIYLLIFGVPVTPINKEYI